MFVWVWLLALLVFLVLRFCCFALFCIYEKKWKQRNNSHTRTFTLKGWCLILDTVGNSKTHSIFQFFRFLKKNPHFQFYLTKELLAKGLWCLPMYIQTQSFTIILLRAWKQSNVMFHFFSPSVFSDICTVHSEDYMLTE